MKTHTNTVTLGPDVTITNTNQGTPDDITVTSTTPTDPTNSPTIGLNTTVSDPSTPGSHSSSPSLPIDTDVPSLDMIDQYIQIIQALPALLQSLTQ